MYLLQIYVDENLKNPLFLVMPKTASHFGLRMKWTADFHRLLNRDLFKNPKQNQNKFKFLSGKALEFSQCLLVCVYFETILKLSVFY